MTPGDLGNNRPQTKISNWCQNVGEININNFCINFPYILTPVPTLYDYSSPIYDQTHVFDLSVTSTLTFDLKFWGHNEDSTSNMYVKFQNNRIKTVVCRARSGLRTEPQTHRQREQYSLSARLITLLSQVLSHNLVNILDFHVRYISSRESDKLAGCYSPFWHRMSCPLVRDDSSIS